MAIGVSVESRLCATVGSGMGSGAVEGIEAFWDNDSERRADHEPCAYVFQLQGMLRHRHSRHTSHQVR
jgi:hypothetical protein